MGKFDLEPRSDRSPWPLQETGGEGLFAFPRPGRTQPSEPKEGLDLNLATIWRIAWEWRWLILSAVGAGLALATIVSLLTTPLYKSTAVLEINPPSVQVLSREQGGEEAVPNDPTFLATQYGLLSSHALAERVAQDLNLASNEQMVAQDIDRKARVQIVTADLLRHLSVDPEPESRLVKISFLSPDPQLAARIVNGFADSFINSGLERRYESSSYARDFLQRQIANVRRELETSERALVAYAQQQGIIITGDGKGAPTDAGTPTGETLMALNRSLADAQTRRIAAEQRYREALRTTASAEVNERTQTLRNQRATLQSDYDEKLQVFRPDYPDLQRMKARLDALDRTIRQEEANVRESRAGTQRAEYDAAVAEEGELRSKVGALRRDVLNLRGRTIQYTILQRDVDTNRSLYEALLQRYKEIGVAGGVGSTLASIVDHGSVASSPSKPNLILNLVVGFALGLAAGFGVAMVLEFVNDTIKTPDDVRNRLGLAFLGGIPAARGRKPVDELRDPTSPVSEAYFSSATSLRFTTQNGIPKTLLLTSTRPAEGKSTTAWALAQNFARLGNTVLLIDADMRKPAFVTGHEKEDGLSTCLTSPSSLSEHVIQTDHDGLNLLPCGPLPPSPAELLSSPRLMEILKQASSEFDLVVVDGPPILGLADSPLLSVACEGTLMVLEAGRTRTTAAQEALRRLRTAGGNVVGAILTRYRHDAAGYGYNYDAYTYRSVEQRSRNIRAITNDAA